MGINHPIPSERARKSQEYIKSPVVQVLGYVGHRDASSLSKLKKNLDELEMRITDSTSLRSLKPIMELLHNSYDDDEESDSKSTASEASSLAEALQANGIGSAVV
jgi:hypothetical protein